MVECVFNGTVDSITLLLRMCSFIVVAMSKQPLELVKRRSDGMDSTLASLPSPTCSRRSPCFQANGRMCNLPLPSHQVLHFEACCGLINAAKSQETSRWISLSRLQSLVFHHYNWWCSMMYEMRFYFCWFLIKVSTADDFFECIIYSFQETTSAKNAICDENSRNQRHILSDV